MKKKTKKKKEVYVQICPKCGSMDVHTDFSNPAVWAYGANTNYKCKSCGHIGNIFPEVLKDEVGKYRANLKEKIDKKEVKPSKEPLIDVKTGFNAIYLEIFGLLIISIIIFSLGFYRFGLAALFIGFILLVLRRRNLKKK